MDPNQNYMAGMPYSNNPAMPYMNKALGEVKGYYDPYTEYAGNPEDLVDRIMGRFNDSPALQRSREEQMRAFQNTAASQGRALNPMTARNAGDLASSLYSQQMQDYLNNVFNQQQLGLNAAQGAAGDVGNIYNQAGGLAYKQYTDSKQKQNDLINSLIKGALTVGGAALGGPVGGALGGAAGNWMSSLFNRPNMENEGSNNPLFNAQNWNYSGWLPSYFGG